jgi:phage tail-like protein
LTAFSIQIPSVLLDNVREDRGDATQASLTSGNGETFALTTGLTLTVKIDGGGVQTITFNEVDFEFIGEATAAEIAAVLNGPVFGLVGAIASVSSGKVRITSETWGSSSSVQVTGGSANLILGFSTSTVYGSDRSNELQLINRIPEPGETGHPRDGDIAFDLHDGDGTAPSETSISVTIAGELAITSGVFQTGFTGSFSNPDASILRVLINPTTLLDSDDEVEVVVITAYDTFTYSFYTEDLTVPKLTSALHISRRVVRATFDEAVKQVNVFNSDDALNIANYSFLSLQAPSVSVTPVEVTPVDSSTVDIELDMELSFEAQYQLVVTNVEDVFGNEIAAPNNSVLFSAMVRPWPEGRRFELIEFLPQINRTEDVTGDLHKFIYCIQDVTDQLLCDIDDWVKILDPDYADEQYINCMLDDLGNPFAFVESLSLLGKRKLLRVLVDMYREKGTKASIINLIRFFLGIEVTIETFTGLGWVLAASDNPTLDGANPPDGIGMALSSSTELAEDPATLGPGEQRILYSFRVISPVNLTSAQVKQIEDIANFSKPAHTHLLGVIQPTTEEIIDHVMLGFSSLGGPTHPGTFRLHSGDYPLGLFQPEVDDHVMLGFSSLGGPAHPGTFRLHSGG